ncbi:MAG: cytochrome b/b6 domain-containing protein [Paraglaciecola sp.]|uniref:cytochrome b n=1 Tax=Paraglaciecola sp. TaxID=1920173 RepID=UPI003298AF20
MSTVAKQNPQDYRVAQKIIHFLMAFFIIMDMFVANKYGGEMELAERIESRTDHATLGVTLIILLILRFYFRFKSGAPAIPETGLKQWQLTMAKFVHVGLYFSMAALLATGVLTAMQATDPILVYYNFDITLGRLTDEQFVAVRIFHEIMTWVMIAFIVVHVVGALYHHFVLKDRLLIKMLKLWTSEKS